MSVMLDSRDEQITDPVDDLYMISATICSQQSSSVHIEIVRNGEQLMYLGMGSLQLLYMVST